MFLEVAYIGMHTHMAEMPKARADVTPGVAVDLHALDKCARLDGAMELPPDIRA
jgi:hypothetical protein